MLFINNENASSLSTHASQRSGSSLQSVGPHVGQGQLSRVAFESIFPGYECSNSRCNRYDENMPLRAMCHLCRLAVHHTSCSVFDRRGRPECLPNEGCKLTRGRRSSMKRELSGDEDDD